ncbi:MAG: hydantoinase B/oxoprolinase family protein [Magnetococcales bacterium]|nr:hydantoinase B/oxoprolinase family protein [Magnetococcales bacterium]
MCTEPKPTHSASHRGGWRFAVDRGGTFTDVVAIDPTGAYHGAKLLSQSQQYDDAAIEGIRRFLGSPTNRPLPHEQVAWIRLGTTVATNALLERKGAPVGLFITQGFQDLLDIGSQHRPDLFALAVRRPEKLYQAVAECEERMGVDGLPLRSPTHAQTRAALIELKQSGVESLAIVFLHAWKNPRHELYAAEIAKEFGFKQISLSHQTLPLIQMVGRGRTTLLDAYLTPVLRHYSQQVRRWTGQIPLHFMSSTGGLMVPEGFTGKDAILSGPAGGVTGVAAVANQCGAAQVIGFDMGGTSTDVCRYDGTFERVMEAETAGIHYQAPMLNVETVAAGGGSILYFDGQKLSVGPDSAGSDPGPACYGLGGPATITDANLILGRIVADYFPKLFGADRHQPLDIQAARLRMAELLTRVNSQTKQHLSLESLALGFVRIANEAMGRPIKNLSVARGFDLRNHALICFGGAGGQHGCGIASGLAINTLHLHPLSGLLSAFGIAQATHSLTHVETLLTPLNSTTLAQTNRQGRAVARGLTSRLREESAAPDDTVFSQHLSLDIRLAGTDSSLTIDYDSNLGRLTERFNQQHRQHYGFSPSSSSLEILNLRVEVTQQPEDHLPVNLSLKKALKGEHKAERMTPVWFTSSGATQTPLYLRERLIPGRELTGPALIAEPHAITVVEPGFVAHRSDDGLLTLERKESHTEQVDSQRDPVLLELFNHRFSGLAARMGETLARTSHSVNMKERLDFSCALFDAKGRLVANAPHVPVHLGAMGATVCALINSRAESMEPGDVYLSNDPNQGGSHLPDLTVITPVFRKNRLAFFVAARGHHADIGGIVPGSMPPFARLLAEEGVVLSNELLVKKGLFLEEAIVHTLSRPPYPARNIPERLSDLKAMVAAGARGVRELDGLCNLYGDEVISSYMGYMRDNATHAMEGVLSDLLRGREVWSCHFEDHMDEGETLAVTITISQKKGGRPKALLDFSGTSPPHQGNLNAPTAITRAAVLYVFRTLIKKEIPLNDGCLTPLSIHIPPNCLLNPPKQSAVSGGNVETSQRIVDVLYGALGVAAASQGTMNNFLFGNPDGTGSQYYETIAGGAGATHGFDGASGVQVHMTNTRITDPELLEHRFPQIRLEQFSLRRGSGGDGKWRGGDGVIRRFLFLAPLTLTLLSQRRTIPPYGCQGGEPGAKGENLFWPSGTTQPQPLPGRFQQTVQAGDRLEIRTPGGGGFGVKES